MGVLFGAQDRLTSDVCREVFSYRRKVFVEHLGWPLSVQNGEELDEFDRDDTVYVVMNDVDGDVVGCARLLPTTKPYLLGSVFPQLLNGRELPCSPDVWELSRFAAVDFNAKHNLQASQCSSEATIDLLNHSVACAVDRGAKRLITVSPIGVERLLRKTEYATHRAGPPVIVNGEAVVACWIEIS